MERNTPPPPVPANSVVPLEARARILLFVGCVVAVVQVTPPSVERNTPPPSIPSKSVVPLEVRHL
jgi:hypothetical protein